MDRYSVYKVIQSSLSPFKEFPRFTQGVCRTLCKYFLAILSRTATLDGIFVPLKSTDIGTETKKEQNVTNFLNVLHIFSLFPFLEVDQLITIPSRNFPIFVQKSNFYKLHSMKFHNQKITKCGPYSNIGGIFEGGHKFMLVKLRPKDHIPTTS